MEYYYNWQRMNPYASQYQSNISVNQYTNNSYVHQHPQQQQSNKSGYFNWNNCVSSAPGHVSYRQATQQSQTTPLPPQVPSSTPVPFQSSSTPYYEPYQCNKSNNLNYNVEQIYYSHRDYKKYQNSKFSNVFNLKLKNLKK